MTSLVKSSTKETVTNHVKVVRVPLVLSDRKQNGQSAAAIVSEKGWQMYKKLFNRLI